MAKKKIEIVIAGNASSLQRAVGQSHKSLQKLDTGFGSAFKNAAKFAASSAGIAGVGLAITGIVRAGASFEKQMSTLGAVTDANARQMSNFKKQAIDAGIKTKFSALQAAEAQTELAKGGLNVKQIMGGGLKAALSLAAAGDMDLADAAATAANAMNLFHLEGGRANHVADMLATAANATTADVSDFAMALQQGGSAAKQAGLTLTDTTLILEGLAKAGIKNSDAGTSMKTAILQLLAPTNKQIGLQEKLGLSFVDGHGKMKKVTEIAGMLRDKLGGMGQAARVATLKALAGTDGFRTLAGLYDLGAKNAGKLREQLQKHGVAAEVAAKKQDNLSGRWENFKGTMETLAIIIFTKAKPSLEKALKAVSDFAKGVMDGTGAGGRFVDKLKEIWDRLQPVIGALKTTVKFLAQHPQLLAAAGAAWVAYKTAAVAQIAIVKAAELGLFGGSMRAKLATRAGGTGALAGKSFAAKAGLAAAAAVGGWEIGKWLRKNVDPARKAGDAIGNALGKAIFGGAKAELLNDDLGPAIQRLGNRLGPIGHAPGAVKPFKEDLRPKTGKGLGGPTGKGRPSASTSSVGGRPMARAAQHFNHQQLMDLWVKAGGDPKMANTMAAIAEAESNGESSVVNGIGATGLWQIHPGGSQFLDPLANAREAVRKLASQGLNAWTTYSGADTPGHAKTYLQYMGGGKVPSGGGRRSGPTPAQLRAMAKKNAATKGGALKKLKGILSLKGPGAPSLAGLPGLGDFSNDTFRSDSLLTALHGSADVLQAGFDSADRAATGHGLRGALDRAASGVRGAKAGKGEKPADFSKRMSGLVGKVRDAKSALSEFTKEGLRAKALKTIDLKIQGIERAKAYREAINGIRQSLHDAAKTAADSFRTLREGQISKAHDDAIALIGDSADARELAGLQAQDVAEQDRKTTEQLNQDLADAVKSGDVKAQKDAQDAIAAYKRQKREDELAANITAATKAADDAQTAALGGLDQEVADFQTNLDDKLAREADQLSKRAENYSTFLKNVQAITGPYGLNAVDVIGASAEQEAAVNGGGGSAPGIGWSQSQQAQLINAWIGKGNKPTPQMMAWIGSHPGAIPGYASGGTSPGGWSWVGEHGRELVNLPSGSRVYSNAQSKRMGGYTVNGPLIGHAEIKHPVDVERVVSRLAFRLG